MPTFDWGNAITLTGTGAASLPTFSEGDAFLAFYVNDGTGNVPAYPRRNTMHQDPTTYGTGSQQWALCAEIRDATAGINMGAFVWWPNATHSGKSTNWSVGSQCQVVIVKVSGLIYGSMPVHKRSGIWGSSTTTTNLTDLTAEVSGCEEILIAGCDDATITNPALNDGTGSYGWTTRYSGTFGATPGDYHFIASRTHTGTGTDDAGTITTDNATTWGVIQLLFPPAHATYESELDANSLEVRVFNQTETADPLPELDVPVTTQQEYWRIPAEAEVLKASEEYLMIYTGQWGNKTADSDIATVVPKLGTTTLDTWYFGGAINETLPTGYATTFTTGSANDEDLIIEKRVGTSGLNIEGTHQTLALFPITQAGSNVTTGEDDDTGGVTALTGSYANFASVSLDAGDYVIVTEFVADGGTAQAHANRLYNSTDAAVIWEESVPANSNDVTGEYRSTVQVYPLSLAGTKTITCQMKDYENSATDPGDHVRTRIWAFKCNDMQIVTSADQALNTTETQIKDAIPAVFTDSSTITDRLVGTAFNFSNQSDTASAVWLTDVAFYDENAVDNTRRVNFTSPNATIPWQGSRFDTSAPGAMWQYLELHPARNRNDSGMWGVEGDVQTGTATAKYIVDWSASLAAQFPNAGPQSGAGGNHLAPGLLLL